MLANTHPLDGAAQNSAGKRDRPDYLALATWACLPAVLVLSGCGSGESKQAGHHTAAHRPADYPGAMARLNKLHQEILSRPLAPRIAHHGHHHHHSHDHGDHHHHDHEHEKIDALQEMVDIVRWLPALAADSELAEDSWNRVDAAAGQIASVLATMTYPDPADRRAAYQKQAAEIEGGLRELETVARLFTTGTQVVKDAR